MSVRSQVMEQLAFLHNKLEPLRHNLDTDFLYPKHLYIDTKSFKQLRMEATAVDIYELMHNRIFGLEIHIVTTGLDEHIRVC